MSWIILVFAGLMEVGFTFCLGKTKTAAGKELALWWFVNESATFWRIFFMTTLILSIIGLKVMD